MNKTKNITLLSWFIWLAGAIFFTTLKKMGDNHFAGYITFLLEVICDFLAVVLCFLVLRSSYIPYKNFFKFQLLSFVFSVLADGSFNFFINIIGAQVTTVQYAYFDLPFLLFLFFQSIGWYVLLQNNLSSQYKLNYPFYMLSLLLFLTFIMGTNWSIGVFTFQGVLHIFETLIESLSFLFITYALVCTDSSWLRKVGFGHLIVISSDFLIRNTFVNGAFIISNPAEIFWVLGLIIHVLGLYEYYRHPIKIKLKKINQAQPIFSVVLLLFSIAIVIIFVLILMIFMPNVNAHLLKAGHAISALVIVLTIISISMSIYISDLLSDNIKELKSLKDGELSELPSLTEKKAVEIIEFSDVKKIIFSAFETKTELLKQEKKLTEKVLRGAHDIRSPIASLECLLENKGNIDLNVLSSIAFEIKEIASDLLNSLRETDMGSDVSDHSLIDFLSIISLIINDFSIKNKNIEFKFRNDIDDFKRDYIISFNLKELKRSVSNILNNAVDSYSPNSKGLVEIKVNIKSGMLLYLSVIDYGKGVPKNLLGEIFKERFTHDKDGGTGIGLSYVVDVINNWKAKYDFSSIENRGSTFSFIFKCRKNTYQYRHEQYVLIDDKDSVRQAWSLKASISNINLIAFKSAEDFLGEISNFSKNTAIYIDFDLKKEKSGLDLAHYLYEIGYQRVYITTGFQTLKNIGKYWQDRIVGKYPPF